MIREHEHDPSFPLSGWARSSCVSSQSEMVRDDPLEPLHRQASYESIKPRVTASLIYTALCSGWQIKAKQHQHLVKSQINFASLKPLQQQQRLKSPQQTRGLANWWAAWTRLWLTLNLNEFTQSCCDILAEEVKHTCNSPCFIPQLHQRRPGTSAWWTRQEIKENAKNLFNNLFAYDYRKNTEREMLIFVLVFAHFLQSSTPLNAQKKKSVPTDVFFLHILYSFRYGMNVGLQIPRLFDLQQ